MPKFFVLLTDRRPLTGEKRSVPAINAEFPRYIRAFEPHRAMPFATREDAESFIETTLVKHGHVMEKLGHPVLCTVMEADPERPHRLPDPPPAQEWLPCFNGVDTVAAGT